MHGFILGSCNKELTLILDKKVCLVVCRHIRTQIMSRLEKPEEVRRKMAELRAQIQRDQEDLAQKEAEMDRALEEVRYELDF